VQKYSQGGVKRQERGMKRQTRGSEKIDNRVEKDRQKGGSIKRQATVKGLQKRQVKRGCKMKGRGAEKDRQRA
jgi:hypothetical protein